MSSCYLCTIHSSASPNPDAVMHCSTCGVFACIWDGARLHGKGASECAICMVRVLVASANRSLPPAGPGGGGGLEASVTVAAQVREYLGTDAFEHDAAQLALISREHRQAWRPLLANEQLPTELAYEFAQRLDGLADGRNHLTKEIALGLVDGTLDRDLLADAAGVGEYARRLKATGPKTLASVAAAEARRAERELQEKIEAEQAAAATVQPKYVGHAQREEKQELKVRYMGQ